MTIPRILASPTSHSRPTLEETKGNEHMEPTDHVEVNTRLTLDLATAGKENRRPHKLKKKKLTAQEEEPETPKDARPVDETTPQGFGQLHLDNMRMRNDLYNLTMEQGADRKELIALKCDYMKQRRLLDIYRQMVQGSMELHTALKKQNDELCERMCELAEANSRLWKLRQQVGEGRPTIPPVARTIERGTLSRPIHKPPETKEELKKALAKANRTNSQFSEQNLDLAKLVTTLKTELTKFRYLEESDYDDDSDSDGAFGEFDAQFAIPKNASDRPSKLSSIRPSLVAKDADDNKSDKCETRMAKPTPNASIDIFTQVTNDIHDSKPHDGAKPCSDQPDDEVESISEIKRNDERNESFNETKRNDENYRSWSEIKPTHENVCEIKPHDENKSKEKNQDNEELDSVEEDIYHGETENWDLNNKDDNDDRISNELEAVVEDRDRGEPKDSDMNKDDNDDYTSEVPGTKAKKRGWDDGDDSDEEDAPSKRVKTENIRPVADFRLEVDGGGFLTSAEFLQLITNGASPNPNLPWS